MNDETRELLEETYELAKENNKMLRSMRRSMFWGRVMSYVYWLIVVGTAIGAYYYIQPYVDQLRSFVDTTNSTIDSIKSFAAPKR